MKYSEIVILEIYFAPSRYYHDFDYKYIMIRFLWIIYNVNNCMFLDLSVTTRLILKSLFDKSNNILEAYNADNVNMLIRSVYEKGWRRHKP